MAQIILKAMNCHTFIGRLIKGVEENTDATTE